MSAFAYASTGSVSVAGVQQAMEFMVSIIISVAAVALVGIIVWRGVHFAAAHERQHVGEWLIGLGFGGGLIAGARLIAQTLTGFASGAPLSTSDEMSLMGLLLGDFLTYGLFLLMVHCVYRWHHARR